MRRIVLCCSLLLALAACPREKPAPPSSPPPSAQPPSSPPPVASSQPAGECSNNDDCRAYSDYCTGCSCRALVKNAPDPKCPGAGVACVVDPCMNRKAECKAGSCEIVDTGDKPKI